MKLEHAARQALEALVEIHPGNMTPMAEEAWNKAITALREALKPNREGKYYYKDNACTADNADSPDCICWHDEALAEQAEQGPVAWIGKGGFNTCGEGQPLYAAPVRTKDLTDDEIAQLVEEKLDTWNSKNMMTDFARAVIAADREKNK